MAERSATITGERIAGPLFLGTVVLGSFLIGASFDLRQQFGIDTVAARHFLPSVVVRVGGAFDLLD